MEWGPFRWTAPIMLYSTGGVRRSAALASTAASCVSFSRSPSSRPRFARRSSRFLHPRHPPGRSSSSPIARWMDAAASCERPHRHRAGEDHVARRADTCGHDDDRSARLYRAARLDRHARAPRLTLRSHGRIAGRGEPPAEAGLGIGGQRLGDAGGGIHDGAIGRRVFRGAAPRHDSRSRFSGPARSHVTRADSGRQHILQ